MEGLNLEQVNPGAASQLLKTAQKYITAGSMTVNGQRLVLTMQGKLLADGIAADLFV
jgi:oxygen-independent coproporphyrinogen-3 oxidase